MYKSKRRRKPESRDLLTTGSFSGSFAQPTLSGQAVDSISALSITAVWNAVRIYADTIAGLNIYVAERDPRGGSRRATEHPAYDLIHSRPNRITGSFRFRQSIIAHALTSGNGYAEIEFSGDIPSQLHLLDPRNVTPCVDHGTGELNYRLVREGIDLPAYKVIHIAGLGWDGIRGYSPITIARETLGLAIAQERWQAGLMGNSAMPAGYLEAPGTMKEEAKSRLRDGWNKLHQGSDRSGNVAILDGGLKWVQTSFSPEDAELLISRNFSIAEIARLFNLPQHMLGLLDHATFSNIEEQNIQFYQLSLMPWLVMIEQELDYKLFSPIDRHKFFVTHDVKSLLRGNIAAQTAQNVALFNIGVLSQNEIRASEGLNPIDGGDRHWVPVNNLASIEDIPKPVDSQPTADPVVPSEPVTSADATEIQDTALNGAQIESLLEVVSDVASGSLPVETAKGVIQAAFPTLSLAKIDAILAPLNGFTPKAEGSAAEPSDETHPLPPGALDAIRDMVTDSVSRMVRRECQAVRKGAKRADFLDWVDEFLPGHAAVVTEALTPALRCLSAIQGLEINPRKVAETIAEGSRERLRGLVTTHPPDELPHAVNRVATEWEASRAASIVKGLLNNGQ